MFCRDLEMLTLLCCVEIMIEPEGSVLGAGGGARFKYEVTSYLLCSNNWPPDLPPFYRQIMLLLSRKLRFMRSLLRFI